MSEIRLSSINKGAKENPNILITVAEDKYHSFISRTAEHIACDDNIRVVLLAGPSGSGKTTTANTLADALRARGCESFVVSLDNFYRNSDDPEYPRLASGELDLEAPEALDLSYVVSTLEKISDGEPFDIPRYDFKTASRAEVEHHDGMLHGCVIIEGLHALNPKIFSCLPTSRMLRIFISVSTNIVDDEENRLISGRKLRFIRRMVRDRIYRGADAERTLEMWRNVLVGEDKYLYPYRENADIHTDTFHVFEPSVMKKYVLKLISEELAERDDYARTVKRFAEAVLPIDEHAVPENSLIREFIPGGIYEDLY